MSQILQYVTKRRGGHNHRVGLVLAVQSGEGVYVAWSKCNEKKKDGKRLDTFDALIGREIALNRVGTFLNEGKKRLRNIPHNVNKVLPKFVERCQRYFKTENVTVV